ncbi:SixA phosphatase family protein [Marinobacterium weihaiense]|uniref:Histidine phosphatase family protein n=1 Tax=Marinobacterium weihaiense TaxID=2851016 RepID=A0ABS6M6N3_9GAMM|nr:histidine phosphatase family protein [Marinobacterium weihaiense]MBV0931940.1 histidine phosphatase family protein [Marinobacterium weihaiense]
MKLVLLRHAQAVPGADNDPRRSLTQVGLHQAECMQERLTGLLGDYAVLSSPWQRAMHTAELLQGRQHRLSDALIPSGSPLRAGEVMEAFFVPDTDALVVVTHQPLCGRLISWLCEGRPEPLAVQTCSGALLELDWPAAGMATLVRWLDEAPA